MGFIEKARKNLEFLEGIFSRVPQPLLATHTTLNEKAIGILNSGRIIAEIGEEGVSMSMDQHLWGEPPKHSIFVFDLARLMRDVKARTVPNFYLFPQVLMSETPTPYPFKYKVNSWEMVVWSEINIFQDVYLNNLKYVVTSDNTVIYSAREKNVMVSGSVETTSFSKTLEYWYKFIAKWLMTYTPSGEPGRIIIPPKEIHKFLHSYNKRVAYMFEVNYYEVLKFAQRVCIREGLPIWWSRNGSCC